MAKILIIEDDIALSENLKAKLFSRGYEVDCAPDGRAGLEKARSSHPDLILLDIMTPKTDGFEVCRRLCHDEKTRGIKIIVMTGLGWTGDLDKALSCGAMDHVNKPFDPERLLEKIDKALKA